jgi:hypothetical protein
MCFGAGGSVVKHVNKIRQTDVHKMLNWAFRPHERLRRPQLHEIHEIYRF